jgi:ribosome biogenesis protein BMS1
VPPAHLNSGFVVGKSTLIRSLVKNWTKQNLKETHGPVTVVTGKGRRVTLIE